MDQRDSVWVGIGRGVWSRGGKLDWYAHWVGEGGDRGVEVNTGGVQRIEEINQSVVYEFFEIEDKLTNCSWYFSRVIPPENVYDGTLIDGVVRIYDLWGGESEEGIDGNEDDANGITVNGTSPLKVMISAKEKGGSNIPFPEGGKGTIVGLMN